MQRNQTEHLEIKNIRNKIRNSMDGLLTKLDRAQKKIIDLDCTYEKRTHKAYRKTNRNMERQKDGK